MSTPRIAVLLTNADDSAFAQAYPNDGQKVIDLLRPQRPNWAAILAERRGRGEPLARLTRF